jgi:hypothetical protein
MRKISNSWTVYYKRILPATWIAILIIWTVVMSGMAGTPLVRSGWVTLGLPFAMAIVAIILARRILWRCADEVFDRGDALVVRRGRREAEIPIGEIGRVQSHVLVRPHRITLHLARPGTFGSEVMFIPIHDGPRVLFGKTRIAIELGRRAEDARGA